MAEKIIDLTPFVTDPNAPDAPVKISIRNADTITYQCNVPFEIRAIHGHGPSQGGPKNPFHRPLPFPSAHGSDHRHRTNTGSARPNMQGEYKTTFHADGRDIDPHFIIEE